MNWLVETAPLVLVDGKTGPDDGVAFLLINQFCFFFFSCPFACFVGVNLSSKDGEVDDGDNTSPEQEHVGLPIPHLNQPKERPDSPGSATAAVDCASVND